MQRLLVFVCLFLCSSLVAQVVEVQNFRQLASFVNKDSFVLIDLDDTVFIPAQTLGSDVWYRYRFSQYEAKGLDAKEAKECALADWESVRHGTKMQLVEPDSAQVIHELQKQGIAVMAITSQGLSLATRSILQLKELGVDFSLTSPFKEDIYLLNEGHGVLYRHGIFFVSGKPKASSLALLLQQTGYCPKEIVLLDDREAHVLAMDTFCMQAHIPFQGLRYSFSDARVEAFDKDLAEEQWYHSSFAHILSDDEAQERLARK